MNELMPDDYIWFAEHVEDTAFILRYLEGMCVAASAIWMFNIPLKPPSYKGVTYDFRNK